MGLHKAIGIGMACLVMVVAPACSQDESGDGSDSSTTSTAPTDQAGDEATSTTLEEVTDEQFEDITDDFGTKVDDAGGDFCQLIAASAFNPEAAPSNPDQVKAAVDGVVGYLRALAGAQGVDDSAAAALTSLADDLSRSAEAAGYSIDFLNSEQTTDLFQREDYVQALGALLARSEQECGSTTSTTSAAGG